MSDDAGRRATIARLNDHFRFTGEGGWVFLSAGVAAKAVPVKEAIVHAGRHFDAFTPDNDPHGEHDFGALIAEGLRIVWEITYYQCDLSNAASDPADPATTKRVMAIMLAEEY